MCALRYTKQQVMKVAVIITAVTLFALFYAVAPYLGIGYEYMVLMFFAAPFLLLYMVYAILKYGKASGHTFEERYYDKP